MRERAASARACSAFVVFISYTVRFPLPRFLSREVPQHRRRLYGATSYGTPTYFQKQRDAKAVGLLEVDIAAARNQAIAKGFAERCKAAKEREEAARAAGEISEADEAAAVKLEDMYLALKEGGGYKPYWSSKPGKETRWPVSAMDIVLQSKVDGKSKNLGCLSKTWKSSFSRR